MSGGDGASFNIADWGQFGAHAGDRQPVRRPARPAGGALAPPTAEGGALRSQTSARTGGPGHASTAAILRIDPATGKGLPDNPSPRSADANARRIIGYGLRNPFRFTFRPGTDELWVGDVGWNTWEEIDRVASPTGTVPQLRLALLRGRRPPARLRRRQPQHCESLYNTPAAVAAPYYAYNHGAWVVSRRGLPDRRLVDHRSRVLHRRRPTRRRTTGPCSSATTAATHLGHAARHRRPARPARLQCLSATFAGGGAANPVDLRSDRAVTCFTSTWTAAPSTGSPTPPRTRRPRPGSPPPRHGHRAADRELRRHRLRRPRRRQRSATPGTSTATAPSATPPAPTADVHLHHRRDLHSRAPRHRQPGRDQHRLGHHHRRARRRTTVIDAPNASLTWKVGRHHRLLGARHRRPGQPRCPRPRCSGRKSSTTARAPTATPSHPNLHRLASGSFTAPDHQYPAGWKSGSTPRIQPERCQRRACGSTRRRCSSPSAPTPAGSS